MTSILEPDFPEVMRKWKPEGFDIIFLGSVLHLFVEEQIKIALKNIHKILKPGGILMGRNGGADKPVARERELRSIRILKFVIYLSDQTLFKFYLHSLESLKEELAASGYQSETAQIGWASGTGVTLLLNNIPNGEKMLEFYVKA
jgi:SAM-dependent methyltransferase